MFVEVECESTKKENPLVGLLFSGFYDVPVSYRSLANQLPLVFSLHFKPIDDNLPDYVVPFIFVYRPTSFYVFMSTRQFVHKGWGEYEPTKYTKYVYTKFEYDSFTETDWKTYLIKRMEEAVQFMIKH